MRRKILRLNRVYVFNQSFSVKSEVCKIVMFKREKTMSDILLQIMRGRMMIDPGIVENVYAPWLISLMEGKLQPGHVLREKKEFKPVAFSPIGAGTLGFEKEAFATGGRRAAMAMSEAPTGSIGVVPIIGEFMKYGTDCTYGANEIVPAIYMAGDLKNINALVLEMDSGGGAENAVPPFIDAIKYVQSKGKPVVLHGDMVASAGYYIGSFCDYLMADNPISSAFGSIGVLISFMDYREKWKKEGIKLRQIYAPQSTLKNHEYREMMDNDNEHPLLDRLAPAAARFIDTIKANRAGKIKDNSDAYKGKMFEGADIIKDGLADGFGTLQDAIGVANSMAMLGKFK